MKSSLCRAPRHRNMQLQKHCCLGEWGGGVKCSRGLSLEIAFTCACD